MMDLKKFKKLNKIYVNHPSPKEVWKTLEHEEYLEAFHNNKDCQEWD